METESRYPTRESFISELVSFSNGVNGATAGRIVKLKSGCAIMVWTSRMEGSWLMVSLRISGHGKTKNLILITMMKVYDDN